MYLFILIYFVYVIKNFYVLIVLKYNKIKYFLLFSIILKYIIYNYL